MVLDLYYIPESAPCRAVQMLARALGIELNLKNVNLLTDEHSISDFNQVSFLLNNRNSIVSFTLNKLSILQFNPQRTLPTLVDDDFAIWESRAILVYLVEKYGGETTLYPSDPQERVIVKKRLYLDMGTLYQIASTYFFDIFLGEKLKKVEEALGFLNTLLDNQNYVAGQHLTIADFSLITTVSTIEVIDVDIDINQFPNVKKWVEKATRTVPGYDINESGLVHFKRFIQSKRET